MSIALNPDLEDRITLKVKSGRYRSPAEVIQASLDLLEARDAVSQNTSGPQARPLWESVTELGQEISPEVWSEVPADLSRNLDQHLYGNPKTQG
jgi:Arc/MetJ-type ribon-helix-helix transcriptional regulator